MLLDIKLPDIDGFEVCKILKLDEKTNTFPILFLSGLNETKDKVKAFSAGGVDYITKPFIIEEVLARVKNQMEISQLRTQLEQKATELLIKNDQLKDEVLEQELLNEKLHEAFIKLENNKTAALNLLEDLRKEVDIRKKTEAAIRLSEEKFRNVFEHSPVGKSLTAIDGTINLNQTFCTLLGYSPDELKGLHWSKITHPDDFGITQKNIDYLLRGEMEIVRFQKRYIHKNGSIIWTEVNSFLQKDNDGKPLYLITALNDITQQVLLTEKLRETNQYLENLYNYANAPIIVWDTSLKITRFNQAFENLSGYIANEVIGKGIDILFPENKIESSLNLINDTAKGSRWESVEIEILRKDGEIRIVLWNSANIYDKDLKQIISTIAQGNDITERKKAEILLQDEKDRIRTILDLVGDPIFVKDNEHRITLANSAFYKMFEMDENSVIGFTLVESVPEKERHHFLKVDRSVLDTGIPDLREEELTVGDIAHNIITRKTRFIDESGKKFLVGSIHDITERKLAENVLFKTTEQLEHIGKMARIGGWELDLATMQVNYSRETARIHEVDYPYVPPKLSQGSEFYPPAVWPEVQAAVQAAIEQGTAYDREWPFITAKGNHIWVRVQGFCVKENGNTIKLQGTFQEITERKRAEESLRIYTERLRNLHIIDQAILQALESPEEIVQKALHHITNLLNCQRASVGIFDFEKKEVRIYASDVNNDKIIEIGTNLPERTYGDIEIMRKGNMEIIEDISKMTSSLTISQTLNVVGVQSFINVPLLSSLQLYGVLNIGWKNPKTISVEEIEITNELASQITIAIEQASLLKETKSYAIKLERRVRDRTAQLVVANKELESFAYSVSHDLRAPLRHIDGFAKMLKSELKTESVDVLHFLDIISTSSIKMGTMIDSLLNFSRLGRHSIQQAEIDLNDIVSKIIIQFEPDTKSRNIDWKIGKLPVISGDYNLISLVFENLISNAIKFTSKKEIAQIEIGIYEQTNETNTIFVKDNGAGFDPLFTEKLFGVFQRLHSNEEFEGIGIGLANVKQIINKHGGSIWAEGKIGEGATFYITL